MFLIADHSNQHNLANACNLLKWLEFDQLFVLLGKRVLEKSYANYELEIPIYDIALAMNQMRVLQWLPLTFLQYGFITQL